MKKILISGMMMLLFLGTVRNTLADGRSATEDSLSVSSNPSISRVIVSTATNTGITNNTLADGRSATEGSLFVLSNPSAPGVIVSTTTNTGITNKMILKKNFTSPQKLAIRLEPYCTTTVRKNRRLISELKVTVAEFKQLRLWFDFLKVAGNSTKSAKKFEILKKNLKNYSAPYWSLLRFFMPYVADSLAIVADADIYAKEAYKIAKGATSLPTRVEIASPKNLASRLEPYCRATERERCPLLARKISSDEAKQLRLWIDFLKVAGYSTKSAKKLEALKKTWNNSSVSSGILTEFVMSYIADSLAPVTSMDIRTKEAYKIAVAVVQNDEKYSISR